MQSAEAAGVIIDTKNFIETNSIVDQHIAEEIRKYATENISVVFTSMNAVDAVIDVLELDGIIPDWTIYAMGGVTKNLIKNYFIDSELIADATNSTELAQRIVDNEETDLVFFCGNHRRDELPSLLHKHEITLQEVVVYETVELPVKIEKEYDAILFFSPSAVRSFFKTNKLSGHTVLFAIGKTTAEALSKHSDNKVITGGFPDKEKLTATAIEYLKASRQIL
jgi:uroporphyrinogen-III synthase